MRLVNYLCAALLVHVSAAINPCVTQTTAGTFTDVPCFDGKGLLKTQWTTLTYSIPPQCVGAGSKSCGLIMDICGATMTSHVQNNNTNMQQLGRDNGYVVLSPSIGHQRPPTNVWDFKKDPQRLAELLLQAMDVLQIDESKVHVMGFSQGGMLVWTIVRYLQNIGKDVVASAAPMSGPNNVSQYDIIDVLKPIINVSNFVQDLPSKPIPLLFTWGTKDKMLNPKCYPDSLAHIASAWHLGAPTALITDPHFNHTRQTTRAGTVFEVMVWDYVADRSALGPLNPGLPGGHCFPGSKDAIFPNPLAGNYPLCAFACPTPDAATSKVVIGDEVMKFFIANPKGTTA
eukprot:g2786.t1